MIDQAKAHYLTVFICLFLSAPKNARIWCYSAILWTAEGADGENYIQRWYCWSPGNLPLCYLMCSLMVLILSIEKGKTNIFCISDNLKYIKSDIIPEYDVDFVWYVVFNLLSCIRRLCGTELQSWMLYRFKWCKNSETHLSRSERKHCYVGELCLNSLHSIILYWLA